MGCRAAGGAGCGGCLGWGGRSRGGPGRGGPGGGSWGRAVEVPGLGALNTGGSAGVVSVSCGSAGNCAAGGNYTGRLGHEQGFVADERDGVWGTAIKVPGLAALNKGNAEVLSVSCASAGNCAAGGYYRDGHRHFQGFVAVERNGVWGQAIEVPGLGALNKGGHVGVVSVSCGSAGSCAAGGSYTGRRGHEQGFVAVERNGVWGTAIEVPGLAALNTSGDAWVGSVSCASAGSCVAGGSYNTGRHGQQGFVADERNGVWRKAIAVPGLAAGSALVSSVSCASAGSCAAGGFFTNNRGGQGFVAVERNGVWGQAIEVPGLAALNKGDDAGVSSVSCGSAGSCAAGGYYFLDDNPYDLTEQGFVAVERNGRWGKAIQVPGLKALNGGKYAEVDSVSCGSAGSCAAGGFFTNYRVGVQGFVAVERNGVWGQAIEVPGLAALNSEGSGVFSVSCASAGNCTAGGDYENKPLHDQGFVTQDSTTAAPARPVPSSGTPWPSRPEYPGERSMPGAQPGR